MSELIDKIYDVDKISQEVADVISEIGKVSTTIEGFKKVIEDLEKVTRKAKGTEELAANTKLLNDTVVKGGVEMKRYEAEVQKLNEKTAQLTTSEKDASIAIAKARLELAAATKATKDAAIAEIELTAANGKVSTSYNALQKDLTKAQKAYKDLEKEEQNSAKGQELLKKITDLQKTLKATDASMGNYQRNVGNYASALEGLTPRLGGLAGTLLDIAKAAKASRDDLNKMGGDNGLGVVANPRIPAGLATIMTGLKGVGQSALAMGKAFLANPIGVVIVAVAGAFALVNAAIKENGQATEKLGQVMAPFKMMLGLVLNVVGKMVVTFLDGVLVFAKFGNAVMSVIPGLDKLAEKNNQAIALEKEKQRLLRAGIVDKAADAKEELRIAELKKKIMEKDKYSAAERLAFARDIDKSEKALALDDADRANKNLVRFLRDMKLKGKTQKDYTIEELQQLTDLQTAKYAEQQVYFDRTKKLASRTASLTQEIATEQKADADAQIARNAKILESKRRLIDSGFVAQKDSEEKSLAMNAENFKRQIEDTNATGQLLKNLKSAQLVEENKIKDDWSKKKIEAEKKTAEEFLAIDLKRIEDVQKGIEKQTEILSAEYAKQERDLKKQYSKGLINKAEYDEQLSNLQLKSLLDVNDKTIQSLEKLLSDSKLTDDKRAELSKKLADLKIANENAATDATIKANDDQVKADEDAKNKRVEVAKALASATAEIFGEIANFAMQQSEQKIVAYEKELEASDKTFEKEQTNLDNAIMSDETRAEKQNEINEKKAAAEQVIANKIQAEKIKQAKWDKANAIVQAIIKTGLAILEGAKQPIPLNIIAMALAASVGAIQVATIASQPIPAFEKGGITGKGAALWGEVRPEVAVTPSGDVMLAEKPTISNFDAGTRIYKSVADYEAEMGGNSANGFNFDYDKMGEKMKPANIVLDSRGLWSIVSKQQSRSTMINRRYKLN